MDISKYVDHTILKANATKSEVEKVCKEAIQYGFASVCVNPGQVAFVAKQLAGTDVKVCTVVGFPLGATTTMTKVFETIEAIKNGATEIDMVINVGSVYDGDYEFVYQDIKAVKDVCPQQVLLKVIIETCLLNDEQKVKVCDLCVKAGAEFVKTSTGFSTGGATAHDVELMKKTVGDKALVKASGGVRSLADAQAMIQAGAGRIGTSNGVAFVTNNSKVGDY